MREKLIQHLHSTLFTCFISKSIITSFTTIKSLNYNIADIMELIKLFFIQHKIKTKSYKQILGWYAYLEKRENLNKLIKNLKFIFTYFYFFLSAYTGGCCQEI